MSQIPFLWMGDEHRGTNDNIQALVSITYLRFYLFIMYTIFFVIFKKYILCIYYIVYCFYICIRWNPKERLEPETIS